MSHQFIAVCDRPNAVDGYTLAYALKHPRKRPHTLPKGWRWLKDGEWVRVGDVACDPRMAPVRILVGGSWQMTAANLPVRRKIGTKPTPKKSAASR